MNTKMDKYEKYLFMELERIEFLAKSAKGLITVKDQKNSKKVLKQAADLIEKVLNGSCSYLWEKEIKS